MKMTKIAKILLVSCTLVSLMACSSMKKHPGQTGAGDASTSAVETYGAGDNNSFGGNGNMSPAQLLAKRVYYFDYDSNQIKDSERAAILANADHLVANGHAKILLEGHTDPRGSREYNVALGERRANAVAELIKSKGVNPDQVRVISYGAERLAIPGRTEDAYQQDRRVVLVYLQQ